MAATASIPVYSTDYYMSLLSALSSVQQRDIVTRLTALLKKKEKSKDKLWREFMEAPHADWGGEMPAVEYANTLRNEMQAERDFDTW